VTGWTWDPAVVVALVAAATAYTRGARQRRRRRAAARSSATVESALFAAGLIVLVVALLSPVDRIADDLFWVHMTQHLLVGLVAPLLVVCGRPVTVMSAALSRPTQRELHRIVSPYRRAIRFRRSSTPWSLAAVSGHVLAFWVWHAPPFYDAAIGNDFLHALEHLTLFATGALFWWVIVAVRWRERSGAAVLYLFVAGFASGALAALLTLAPHSLYHVHATTTAAWHLTPLEDQQLAGAVMWVPGGAVYAAAAVVLFVRWLDAAPSVLSEATA
jgi:cytochrome c oxidase assembly factor CtaG